MKKIIRKHFFAALCLLLTGCASAQNLLKLNYKAREINEAGASIKKADQEITRCMEKMDSVKKAVISKESVSLSDAQTVAN
jgi:starvation-inducible outer membrane lipoprotein